MKKNSSSKSAFFSVRVLFAFILCSAGGLLGFAALGAPANPAPSVEQAVDANNTTSTPVVASAKPQESRLVRTARAFNGDLRTLPRVKPVERERQELEDPPLNPRMYVPPGGTIPTTQASIPSVAPGINAPAPPTLNVFEGLDRFNWGAGSPPDPNGDVGPTYYIQTVNTSIGVFRKTDGAQITAFTFDTFMSQGHFGNLCDTNNFGDPVVLYDTFEDRWIITDFAFVLDGSGNVIGPAFQCVAASQSGDPVAGGWTFYSTQLSDALGDYPKFGIWPDGLYMSANMFSFGAGSVFKNARVFAFNKAQMYAGSPTVQIVSFDVGGGDFTVVPSNARLQTGTPPAGEPNFFLSTWLFTNALTVYKFHVDWNSISLSTFTGPDIPINGSSWPNAAVANAAQPGTATLLDVLQIRAMVQNQYTNLGGAESLWVSHTVRRGNTSGLAAPRWYQVNVTGGTVASPTLQGTTWDPDGANVINRFMPSLAIDRAGNLAMGYSTSNGTVFPSINYAGRLATDPVNTFSQTEQMFFTGTASQTGINRWGDYSAMTLDPDGCTFWYTNEYANPADQTSNHRWLTKFGSFTYSQCTAVGNGGTVSGTVTDSATTSPLSGVTVALGSRTTTTNASGVYSFTSIPAGTYPILTASFAGYSSASAPTIAVTDGGTTTQNFALAAAAANACPTDTTQADFQAGVFTNVDATTSPGDIILATPTNIDQQNSTLSNSGVGITTTIWGGQTFTAALSGQLTRADINLFCSGCTGTTPNLTLSVRATSGNLPTGPDLATATLTGNGSGASSYFIGNFASPVTLTAGTVYSLVVRPVANPSAGTYAITRSASDVYANGQRVSSADSGGTWTAPLTSGQTTDAGFKTYIFNGFAPSGNFTSRAKDANPAAGYIATWSTLSWTAAVPATTSLGFQAAASNNVNGPFSFVGPDGTAATIYTVSGGSLSQFNGFRYLKYKAYLSTTNGAVTPTVSDVTACFSRSLVTSLAADPAAGSYGGTVNLSATLTGVTGGVSGKSIDFSLNGSPVGSGTTDGSGVATLSNASLGTIAPGTYPTGVSANFAGDSTTVTSTGTNSLTVSMANQTINVGTHAPASAGYNSQFTVAATSDSGLAVSYSSSGACTNSGATFTMTSGTGTCTVQYDQAGDTNYNPATQVTEVVTATKLNQAINVGTHAPASAAYNSQFTVAATANSSLAVSYSSSGVCTNTGATYTMTGGTGTCTVKYDQAGDINYNPATQVTEVVTATKLNQAINVGTHAPANAAYNSQFTVAATANSSLAVSYSSSGACTNSGATYTMTGGTGTCTVKYDQAGDTNYNPATQVTEVVTATKLNQAINVGTHAPASAAYNSQFTVAATANSSLAVSYSSSGVCTNTGATYTMTSGTGTCTVKYDQAGDANYNAAPQVTESVTAAKLNQAINVGTHAPASAAYNSQFTVAATANSSLAVSYSSSGVCTNTGATYTMTSGTGTCTVKYDQAGDANYNAAPQVTESVTAAKLNQAINVGTHAPASAAYNSQFTVAATANSSLAVSYSSSGVCTNTGATYTMTSGTGTCTVKYDQAGDANYNAAPQVTESVTASKAATGTGVVSNNNPSQAGQQVTFTATVSSGSGTPTGTVTFMDGAASIGTGTLNGSGIATFSTSSLAAGGHSITAGYGADNNFAGSTSSTLTQTVSAPTPTPTPTPTPSPIPTPSPTPTSTPTPTPNTAQALNLSTRLRVATGDNVMIGGFIITGNVAKPVVVRGLGPSLSAFGVSNILADPMLELRGANGSLIVQNDNWKDSQRSQIEGTVFQPSDDRESVILATLPPAAYTAILSGKGQTSGVGLVEVYDNDQATDSQLANISTRGFVGSQDNVMIGGFTLGGNPNNTHVAILGIGPSLSLFGLSNVLADPTLEMHNANGSIMISNDDWQSDPVAAGLLTANGLAPTNSHESGLFVSLPVGPFTVVLSGKNGATGIGVIEIYNLK